MIVAFIGEPCVGKGTVMKLVQQKLLEQRRTATITASDVIKEIMTPEDVAEMRKEGGLFPRETEFRDLLYKKIETMYAMGAEIILLDGFPRSADQTKWFRQALWDHQLQVVRVMAYSDFELAKRAAQRARDEFDQGEMFQKRLVKQRQLLGEVESLIFQYGLPYSTTINDYADRAALEIASRIKLPKREKEKK